MHHVPTAHHSNVARMVCLLALAPVLGITLLVLTNPSVNAAFLGLVALDVVAIARATMIMPRGDEAVFALLWLALGLTLGIAVIGAFSVGPAFLITLVMLIVAIGTAPNRTGRSRTWWPYVAVQALAFGATVSLPFLVG